MHRADMQLASLYKALHWQAQTRLKPFDQAEEEELQQRVRSNSASRATRPTSGIQEPLLLLP